MSTAVPASQEQESPERRFTLLGDQPRLDRADRLGFDQMAADLAELILSSQKSTPFTLGIEADWGMGKSSLMQRIEAKLLEEKGRVTTVWFNAWTADEGGVLEGLIKSVLDRMDPNALRRALRNKRLMGGLRIAANIAAGLLRLGNLVDEVWERVAVDPRARNEMRELMESAMASWTEKHGGVRGDRLLVVFIDDLDRCSPGNVFQVFEAMKLYLDAPGFVFVVGYDANAVSDAVLHEKQYSKSVTSRDYVEKIVQTVYRIQQPGDQEVYALVADCLEQSGTSEIFDPSAQTLVIERNSRNPRRIKRFINGFILEYGRDPDWHNMGATTLIGVLILYMYFPDFARLLDDRSERDPIGEFLDYVDVRDVLRRPPPTTDDAWQRVDRIFEDHKLAPPPHDPEGAAAALPRFEAELPEFFPALAQDQDFASLLDGFGGPEVRDRLLQKLHRRPPTTPSTPEEPTVAEKAGRLFEGPRLDGLRVMWIDDEPDRNREYSDAIIRRGGSVNTATNLEQVLSWGLPLPFDLLISDITREGRDEAGFDDLQSLRDAGYGGPAIFFTTRPTPSRRARTKELDALITHDPTDLFALIEAEAARLERGAEMKSAAVA